MLRKIYITIIVVLIVALFSVFSNADDDALWTVTTEPDALIVLDLSGSMQWLPHGSNPTFYACGSSCVEPYYADPVVRSTPSTLYVEAANCSSDGPYTTTPPSGDAMTTQNLYVAGSDCNVDGPYYLTPGSDQLDVGWYLYINRSSSCGSTNGPFYRDYDRRNHSKDCRVSTYIPDTVYTATNCHNGPFYKTSGSGHTTACKKYRQCAAFGPGYTETDCSTGPFYKTSGSGHTTECIVSSTCTTPAVVYSETDCTTGPFYNTPGTGHTTICQNCSKACSPSGSSYIYSDTETCEGPFYNDNDTGTRTDCSKIKIAKRALFQLLDDTSDNSLTSADVTSLGMRIGLMRYYNCGSQDNDTIHSNPWDYGCTRLSWSMTQSDNTTTTPYASLFCNDASCASTASSCSATDPARECIAGYGISGGTPIGDSLNESKKFLDYHRGLDAAASCRNKSIILITDGEDTFSCPGSGGYSCGNGSTTCTAQRRAPVYWAKKAAEAGYKVYVVGFGGDMPTALQDTLNWAAYYGETRNPNATQSGDTAAVTVGDDPCTSGTDPKDKTLRGYAFMASNPQELVNSVRTALTMIAEATYSFSSQASVAAARVQDENFIYEVSFDPKNNSGSSKEPFWPGHMKKYQIGNDGNLITPQCWDAGEKLSIREASDRSMWTLKNGVMTGFETGNLTAADLGITGHPFHTVDSVVGFYRGDPAYNLELVNGEVWKLGDLFHTNPAIVKTPKPFFYDPRECDAVSYNAFRSYHPRYAANGAQIILAGGNDGQLHCFKTGSSGSGTDCAGGGDELWSFIPPNLLQKLSPIAHYSHADRASLSSHDFFIDGPINVFDAWLPASSSSGISKTCTSAANCEWKTLAVFGEGQGSGNYLWSSSSNCYSASTGGFSGTYDATNYPYYCGLYALDVTDSTASTPTYKWHLMPNASQAPFLGQAWSKMQTGRVKIGGNEKWVGFIGGGYSSAACLSADGTTSTACNTPATGSSGKGFFVVDLSDGSIIWSFTHGSSVTSTTSPYMDFSLASSPLPIDIDNDGFVDTVYVGDLGGNIWRFRLCAKDPYCSYCGKTDGYTASPCTSCNTSNWSGSRLFSSTNEERGSGMVTPVNTHKQIFTQPVATKDTDGYIWIYFGTGENYDPIYKPTTADPDTSATKNRVYGIKEDTNFSSTYTSSQLANVTSDPLIDFSSARGWYMNLSTNSLTRSDGTTITGPQGEKMISDMALFNSILYFTTYTPEQGTGNACGEAGDAFLYAINCFYGIGMQDATLSATALAAIEAYMRAAALAAANPGDMDLAAAAAAAAADAHAAANNTVANRTDYVGHGVGSSVLVSYRPGYTAADIYVTASGGAGTSALTQTMGEAPKPPNMTNVLYWRDRRL